MAELHALSISRVHRRFGLELVATGTDHLIAAVELLRQRPDRTYSLTDAVSFGLMRELAITRAFTLDADFAAEGFEVVT